MGLAVETGMLADLFANDPEGAEWTRESLARVNDVLAENNLPRRDRGDTAEGPWGHCAGLKLRCDFDQIVRITGFDLL